MIQNRLKNIINTRNKLIDSVSCRTEEIQEIINELEILMGKPYNCYPSEIESIVQRLNYLKKPFNKNVRNTWWPANFILQLFFSKKTSKQGHLLKESRTNKGKTFVKTY